jgi:hypothetical protein
MGFVFGDHRAADPRVCQEAAAIAMPGKKNVQAAAAVPLQLVSMPVSELPGPGALALWKILAT